jgi:putative acetyltransferase
VEATPTALVPQAPPLEFRRSRFEDVAEVLRLIARAIHFGCRGHYDRAQRGAIHASYARALFVEALGPFETVIAETRGRIMGFAQLDPASERLRALFVDADCQGRGVGRALLSDVEARAIRRGCRRLHGAMSLNAVPFYAAAGFRPATGADRLTTIDLAIPVVRMEKVLRG